MSLEDLRDTELAKRYLADLLSSKELFLLLGAGVSRGIGLSDWNDLVGKCEKAAGLDPGSPSRSGSELMAAIDRVERSLRKEPGALQDVVRNALYPADYLANSSYPNEIIQNLLLIAIGALVMSSARGSVADVFTLNFDDLLEWYLHLHGFTSQVVSDFPVSLRGDRDVTIYHVHGFVPLVEASYEASDWMILSGKQLLSRLARGHDQPWPVLISSRLMSKRFLAIGTSMQDLDIDVLLERARELRIEPGPTGFAVTSVISDDRADELLDLNVVPLALGTNEAIPDFLMDVCRIAAGSVA